MIHFVTEITVTCCNKLSMSAMTSLQCLKQKDMVENSRCIPHEQLNWPTNAETMTVYSAHNLVS
jgi:hypothetical protein